MPNVKITELPSASALDGTEVLPIVQGGTTSQTTTQDVANLKNYKVYTALLSQSGTDAPTAIVLENTIGEIVWTRDDVGVYLGTLNATFIEDKTFVLLNWGSGNYCIINSLRGNDDCVIINVNESSSPNDAIDVQGLMQIEIRVYN